MSRRKGTKKQWATKHNTERLDLVICTPKKCRERMGAPYGWAVSTPLMATIDIPKLNTTTRREGGKNYGILPRINGTCGQAKFDSLEYMITIPSKIHDKYVVPMFAILLKMKFNYFF